MNNNSPIIPVSTSACIYKLCGCVVHPKSFEYFKYLFSVLQTKLKLLRPIPVMG